MNKYLPYYPPPNENNNTGSGVIHGRANSFLKQIKISDVLFWQNDIKEIDPLKINELTIQFVQKYPFYGQATTNNGIIAYHSLTKRVLNNRDAKPTILIHSNNQNCVYVETPFYLKDGHAATSVLQNPYLNKYIALYLITAIRKVIRNKFNYNAKATKIALKMTDIELPYTSNTTPDYAFMERFMQAVHKLVIKDVVEWTDKKMKAYRKVVFDESKV